MTAIIQAKIAGLAQAQQVKTVYKGKKLTFMVRPVDDDRRLILQVLEAIRLYGEYKLINGTVFDAETDLREIVKFARYALKEAETRAEYARGN